jgi:hypothetical protein
LGGQVLSTRTCSSSDRAHAAGRGAEADVSQATIIGGAVVAGFILYLAANNRLSVYLGMVGL